MTEDEVNTLFKNGDYLKAPNDKLEQAMLQLANKTTVDNHTLVRAFAINSTLNSRHNATVEKINYFLTGVIILLTFIQVVLAIHSLKKDYSYQQVKKPVILTVLPTHIPTDKPIPIPIPHTTFTSDKLGISFTYINTAGEQNFFTREIGDTIYLYNNINRDSFNKPFSGTYPEFLKTIAPGAFSVEVFTKDPQLSLTDAIKQRFLTGYSETDCFINTNYRAGYPREDKSFVTATISIHFPINTVEEWNARMAKCPGGYTEGGRGVLYFMMDTKHPNKLLFVKVGQDNLPSGVEGLTWDGTIKVLQ